MGEGTTDEVSADVVSTYLKNELSAASKRKQVEVEAEAGPKPEARPYASKS